MNDVVIISACRTAIGKFGGTLKDSRQCGFDESRRCAVPASTRGSSRTSVMAAALSTMTIEPGARCGPDGGDTGKFECRDNQSRLHFGDGGGCLRNGYDQGRIGGCHSGRRRGTHVGRAFCPLGSEMGIPAARFRTGRRPDPQPVLWIPVCPGPEKGPLKEGAILEMFKGKPYIMDTRPNLSQSSFTSLARRWMR